MLHFNKPAWHGGVLGSSLALRRLHRLGALAASLLLLLLLGACASTPPTTPSSRLFQDESFKPASAVIDAASILRPSAAMQHFADHEITTLARSKGLRDGLIEALYTKGQLQIEYDGSLTRNAAEAFEARSGNCLSLVLMTAAFARHLGLPVRFQSVFVEEHWTRSESLYFVSGHINLSLSRGLPTSGRVVLGESEQLTVDFLPPEELRGQRSRVIDERTVLAMYFNNRAAEELNAGRLDDAYWFAREAIAADARWLVSFNTLSVIYRRRGLAEPAEQALRHVLAQEPLNTQALANLAIVLRDAGRAGEASELEAQLAQVQPVPPYKFFDQGLAAMRAADYEAARRLFNQELARAAYVPEFHFWLGMANYALGDVSAARKQMALAVENSSTGKDRGVYAAKLDWINGQQQPRRVIR